MKTPHRYVLACVAAAAAHSLAAQTAPTPAATQGAASEPEEVVELTPFEVRADEDNGYQATQTLAGTRIRTDLKDVGSAISVVTKEFLQDIGATDNATLLQYTTNTEVGGVHSTYAGLGNGTEVDESGTLRSPGGTANRVRGLSQADNTRDFFVSDITWDSYNVDRIDLQRGPNSILFGLGKPAGIVNATLRNAEFRDAASFEARVGSYDSVRGVLDVNKELLDNTLAIRITGLWDHEKFRQAPAFEDDERIYGAVRFDPQLFKAGGARTSIRAKYEHGEINANRPRTVTPNDRISPWFRPTAVSAANPFGGMNKLLLSNPYAAEREDTPAIGGDNRGQTRSADPDYSPYIGGRGNQQQPFYFVDGTTGQLYSIYGGYINKGAREATGAIRSPSSAIVGQRFAGIFYGVQGLPQYANSARLPGYQYGQYREQSLQDSSVFDFYNNLIDGDTKAEWENWDAYNLSLAQTAFHDRLGLELIYDRQKYDRGGKSFLGWAPAIDIDILSNLQDLTANPNVGRPYVQGSGNGSSYLSDREYLRGSLFAEFRASDVFDNEFLRKLVGRHRINGVYSGEEFYSAERRWNLYATTKSFDDYTGVPLPFNDRPPISMVYLGPSVRNLSSSTGANIPRIMAPLQLNDGALYHFSAEWTNPAANYGETWNVPANLQEVFNGIPAPGSTTQLMQNSNPANYRGWNSNHFLDIIRADDGDLSTTTNASKSLRKVDSYAGSLQSYLWDNALVGTFGWRYDRVRGKDVRPAATGPRGTFNLSPGVFELPNNYLSDLKAHSTSWGAVLHTNRLFGDRDPLPINVSFSYNKSDNFEIAGTRRNLYGEVIGNPTGKTEDWGILLSTKDDKYTFRAVKYEASVTGASTQAGNMNFLGNQIVHGLRWRNVFLYNLNAYTLDTANGSNEWRYNFDPDTSIGETQDQATARENASIAAWNEIQAWLPASFYEAWGFTPPADLNNPNPAHVQPYADNRPPPGFTMTSDTLSEGYEFELIANPTRNWRVSFNASKTEATRTNVGSAETLEFVNFISEKMAGPAGELRQFSGGPTANTMRINWNNGLGPWTLLKLQEGASSSEIRPWRYNFITNYTFREGMLKNVGVGGSYRWQDKVIIGYPVVALSPTSYTFDLDQPYHGPAEDAVDLWASYERKLTDRVNWKIQLNVRNAFASDGLIPISVQPDGQTWASVRVKPNRQWFVTNTFSF